VALLGAAVIAAPALAGGGTHTFTVTTLAGSGPGSLADAIEDADAGAHHRYAERARVVFAVAGEISLGATLPAITVPLEIDATTAPGYAEGAPVVAIAGGGTVSVGLEVGATAGGSRVLGLAIGGFGTGIVLAGSDSSVCSDFIGTDLTGTVAAPNGVGLEISGDDETIGGTRCCGGGGNLISGNEEYGIVNLGSHNHIAANLIGTDATGTAPLPNGAAGIRVGSTATATLIGGSGVAGPGNTIAFNRGPGVLVEPGATGTEIIANSIFANEGLGIEIPAGGGAPPSPELTGLLTGFAATEEGAVVKGTLAGEPESAYTLEFFAGETCAPSGQGRTFLGTFALTTDAAGEAAFETDPLAPLPAGTKFITATATGGASSSTSEFSACLGEPEPPEPELEPVRPTPPVLEPPIARASSFGVLAAAASGPEPINGATVTIEPKVGKVRVLLPGEKRFRPITELESVPIGSVVDATNGKARIASATAFETVQSAAFFGGLFKILQQEGKTLTTMRLLSGPQEACGSGGEAGSGATASAAGPSSNHLWGSGKGSFRTEGRNGSATVRGTIWFVADRCEGTFFRVNRGIVAVRDFTKQVTVAVRAGQTYLAEPPA
jgi:hypothetical protein